MNDVEPSSVADAPSLTHLPLGEILTRLDEAHDSDGGGVLATDADGTIWDGDVGVDIFEALLAAEGVRAAAHPALRAEAARYGVAVEVEGSPTAAARALYAAFSDERYAHEHAFAMMAWVFAGWHRDEVSAFAAKVLDAGKIESRIRPEMQAIFRWAERRAVPIYVVSASPIAIVALGARRLGVPVAAALAMTPAVDEQGLLLPHLAAPPVYGPGKILALERASVTAQILGAFGDSAYDAEMLRCARVPVAVTPSAGLLALLPSIERASVLLR
ncbi:MAG: haloacid dehalogenase-like hydrolase [Byssovorax sp.]